MIHIQGRARGWKKYEMQAKQKNTIDQKDVTVGMTHVWILRRVDEEAAEADLEERLLGLPADWGVG